MRTPYRAVLWDLDGTIVDTEPYWIEAEAALAAEYDAPWTHEDGLALIGNDLYTSARYIRSRTGVPLTEQEIIDRLVGEATKRMVEHLPWRPGARELLTDLRATDVPCALVTMSWAVQVEPVLHALGDDVFHAVVTGDSVTHGKPHPEPYLTAAAALGLRPEECLAIEDSHTGATSAESAGCTVLCVPNHVPIPPGERRIIADTLAGTSAAALLGHA